MSAIRSFVPLSYGDIKHIDAKPWRSALEPVRIKHPHACEHCGHEMEFADQQCACTSRSNR